MVAEGVSAKGPHSLIRRNRRKRGGGGQGNNTLVCTPASRSSPCSVMPLRMQSVCKFRWVLIASFCNRMGGRSSERRDIYSTQATNCHKRRVCRLMSKQLLWNGLFFPYLKLIYSLKQFMGAIQNTFAQLLKVHHIKVEVDKDVSVWIMQLL